VINYYFMTLAILNFFVLIWQLIFKKYSNKLMAIFLFILSELVIFLFIFRIIIIKWSMSESDFGLMYSVLNAYLMGAFLVLIGFGFKNKESKNRLLILVIVTIILITSASLIGVSITINLGILLVKEFVTNTGQGALFFTGNIVFFDSIIIASFLAEGEVK